MRKGFTLSELLVCLAILGLIIVVAIPSIIGAVNRNKERQYELMVEEIKISTEEYINDNRNSFTTTMCTPNCIVTIEELITAGKLDGDIKNPKTSESLNRSSYVEVTINENGLFEITGTLDPLATGVLVLGVNEGTKLIEIITSYDKEYIATIRLGIETDTLDITGNIVNYKVPNNVTKENIDDCLKRFTCKYEQEVPKYSAVKINGKKLYQYARNNEEITLPKREVTIFSLERISDIENI